MKSIRMLWKKLIIIYKNMENKKIIISLGGSIVVPELPNPIYVKSFIDLIKSYTEKGIKFIIIVGGGKTCRNYQYALKEIRNTTNDELDWLGIYSTIFNAEFVKLAFGNSAHSEVIRNPKDLEGINADIIIGAGWKPGCSTDYDAILCAEDSGANSVINLSNIDFAYTKDPKQFPDAEKIIETTWSDFRKLLPNEWDPGLNAPFDPIAAKKAEELGIEVAIMNGNNLENLKNYLDGLDFIGTKIK